MTESDELRAFIQGERAKGIFIFEKGEIEAYLPAGHKDLEGLIRLVSNDGFWEKLDPAVRPELEALTKNILRN